MRIITPIDIDDTNMTSSITEPDASQGEVEWEDRLNVSISDSLPNRITTSCLSSNGFIYGTASNGELVKLDVNSGSITSIGNTGVACNALVSAGGFLYGLGQSTVLKVDTSDDSYQTFGSYASTVNAAELGGDGNVYGVGDAGIVTKVSTSTSSVSTFGSITGDYDDFKRSPTTGVIYGVGPSQKILKVSVIDQTATEIDLSTEVPLSAAAFDSSGIMYCVSSDASDTTPVVTIDSSDDTIDLVGFVPGSNSEVVVGRDNALYTYSADYASSRFDLTSFDSEDVSGYPETALTATRSGNYIYSFGDSYASVLVTGYAEEDLVIKTSTHKIYQAATDTYDDPEVGVELVPQTWTEVSATNKYKAFDYTINTQSVHDDDSSSVFSFTLTNPNTTISLFGMEYISDVTITVREDNASGSIIYTSTKSLVMDSPIEDTLVNDDFLQSKAIFEDLPTYATPYITIDVTSTADDFYIGDIVLGNERTLGVVEYESETSRTSYDTIETDTFGNETIVNRPSAEYTTFEVRVVPEYANYVERILQDSMNKARVWVGDGPEDEKLFTFGYYERSPLSRAAIGKYDTTLKIRGLV